MKEFEWFEWFEWFGPSPIEPFNSEVADAVKVLGVVLVLTSGLATVFYKQICGLFQR